MKVAVDVSQIIYGTGVSRYTRNLINALSAQDKENEYLFFGGSFRRYSELASILAKYGGRAYPMPPAASDFIWNTLHLFPIEILIGNVDVFHSSDWSQPRSSAFKVTTVHDLAPILYPEFTDPGIVSVHKRRLALVKREVDRIIVPTRAIKEDLVEAGFGEEKIRVVYEGVDPGMGRVSKEVAEKVKKKYNVPGKYLLSVGVNKRKNTERIIEAFRSLDDKDLQLVIIGRQYSDITGAPRVIFTGHVTDDELNAFYGGAEVLVYPSIYEGFGLPILDSFTCSTPVVTSSRGSMKEVAGNAAVLVDPESVDDIAGGIKKALKNRSELVKKGRVRVKDFTWEKCARETLAVYKEGLNLED